MHLILGADQYGKALKDVLKQYLLDLGYTVTDVSKDATNDFVDVTLDVVRHLNEREDAFGIVVDAYGAGPFMTACRVKGMIAAEVSDERTAYMTRSHNNTRLITIGAEIVGEAMAKNILKGFVEGTYEGGRHQIRVDMLNKMGSEVAL